MVEEKKDSVLKKGKQREGYTMVRNSVLDSPLLSLKAKGLFCYLQSRATQSGWRFSKQNILRLHKDGRRSFEGALQELKDAGHLTISPIRGKGGKFKGWEWVIENKTPKGASKNELK